MKTIYKCLIPLFFLLVGCTIKHDYVWNEYPIESGRITSSHSLKEGQQLHIIKGKSNTSKTILGKIGAHEYYGSEQSFTDAIANQLVTELEKMGFETIDTAQKSLEIVVNKSSFERGMWKIAAILEFAVNFGNGNSKSYTVRNSSPTTVDRTYNGVVALAAIEILNDPDFITYINE